MNRAFSFGGGRQSTAALVLAAQGRLDVDLFVFANVGNDAENPDTLEYVEHYAKPFARDHGIELVEVQRSFRDGRNPSLYQYTLRAERSFPLPMRMANSGGPAVRTCTVDWKIRVIARYLKRERGWPTPWITQLGISWDEAHRMRDPEQRDVGDYTLGVPTVRAAHHRCRVQAAGGRGRLARTAQVVVLVLSVPRPASVGTVASASA